jgi:hypothetical protein
MKTNQYKEVFGMINICYHLRTFWQIKICDYDINSKTVFPGL